MLPNLSLSSHFFLFLQLQLRHMEVPRLGVQSELQLPAYTTATATWDLSHICDLHGSLQQPTEQGQGSKPHPLGDNITFLSR